MSSTFNKDLQPCILSANTPDKATKKVSKIYGY